MKTAFEVSGNVAWKDNGSVAIDLNVEATDAEDAISKYKQHCKKTLDTPGKKEEGFYYNGVSVSAVNKRIQFVEVVM